MKPPDYPNNPSDEQEKPRRRTAPLPSRILERAAREQLGGPFGKLGRYALKQHWGITVSDIRENESSRSSTGTAETNGKIEKKPARTKGLFRRLLAHLKRPFRQ
jgi:hypothetical protein